jgi:N-acetylglutamate synthase-like GNAT family acetyltransferase
MVYSHEMKVRWAQEKDIEAIKALADANRGALGFVVRASLKEQLHQGEILVAEHQGEIMGFVSFHHRRDGWTTIRELCVAESYRKRGTGRALVQEVEKSVCQANQKGIRLKCPLDLPANGFYARLGFTRVAVVEGKRRPLAVWEKPVCSPIHRAGVQLESSRPAFFLTLTHQTNEIRQIVHLWQESGDIRNPFAQVIFTPLFCQRSAINLIRQLKEKLGSVVMFDSGGYQVQMGKASYEELFDRLLHFYRENNWADWYVLPDHVPRSTDSDREVEFKVRETIDFARLFVRMMPDEFAAKAVGVVHGRTKEHVRRCIEAYAAMGIRYIGFGSFGTSGPNGTINLISQRSLKLLRLVQTLAHERGLQVHIFGIGSPSHLIRLAKANIIPTSFDSAGWWKAGGFGNVFFPGGRQLHITAARSFETTLSGLERQRRRSGHKCPFCDDLRLLRRRRMKRILHNLVVMLDTIEHL